MAKVDSEIIYVSVATIVVSLVVGGLLYGMFVYNHTQDVNRDKFLIEHCAQVSQDKSEWANAKVFSCGATKK